jgi:hypothetical protein
VAVFNLVTVTTMVWTTVRMLDASAYTMAAADQLGECAARHAAGIVAVCPCLSAQHATWQAVVFRHAPPHVEVAVK